MKLTGLAAAFLAVALTGAAPAAEPPVEVFGVWSNPKQTVHIDITPCGVLACGTVVWANADAQAKSKKASGKELIGLQLFHDMRRQDDGTWRGRAFVPDLNMTFTGFAQPVTHETLKIKGCLIRNMFCRSQVWTRVS